MALMTPEPPSVPLKSLASGEGRGPVHPDSRCTRLRSHDKPTESSNKRYSDLAVSGYCFQCSRNHKFRMQTLLTSSTSIASVVNSKTIARRSLHLNRYNSTLQAPTFNTQRNLLGPPRSRSLQTFGRTFSASTPTKMIVTPLTKLLGIRVYVQPL
jgi:hypothetical protein